MKRRTLLKIAGSVASSYFLGATKLQAAESDAKESDEKAIEFPQRTLGRTGRKISIIGFPGLVLTRQGQDEGTKAIHKAFEQGINYFDVAPSYGKGDAEIKMGIGLQGIDRSKIFLSCKTNKRDKDGAREELERSLSQLKTDHFDLYQLHAITRAEDIQQALGPSGAMETFIKAKEEGKVKHFGFPLSSTLLETANSFSVLFYSYRYIFSLHRPQSVALFGLTISNSPKEMRGFWLQSAFL